MEKLIKRRSCHHIETSQWVCGANQSTGFYVMATLVFNERTFSNQKLNFGSLRTVHAV